jgi:PDZ domain-containing protein
MKRRGVTVLIGFLLVAGLTVLAGQARVPYVQLQPGPTYDTLGKDDTGKDVIKVTGATATSSAGQLRFVTIGVLKDLTLVEALVGWWRSEDAVVPRELIYPPDQTEQQVEKHNADDFAASQSAAQTAALKELGYPMQIKVKDVTAGSPAQGKLLPGDMITTIDGVAVNTADKMLGALRGKPAGTTFAIGVNRGGQTVTVQVPTAAGADGVPRIGVTPEITSTAPFKLDIPIENIGGPSAGLMLTLGIIDKIKPEDLTGGKIIAGTGTIDADGKVGPIGGVPQKLVASKNAGAKYFLTPKDNCAEAVANQQAGLPLVQVASLNDALAALADIRAGKQPQLCPGAS